MLVVCLDLAAIVAASLLGNLFKKSNRKEVLGGVMVGIGAVIAFIGAAGISLQVNALVLLLAFVLGGFLGYWLDFDGHLETASAAIEKKFGMGRLKIIGPGMNFFIVSCSGAYTVNACFFAGMGDTSLLFVKVGLDFVVSMAMSATLGVGVMFSIVPTAIYECALIAFSGVISPLMSEAMLDAFATAGSMVSVMIGLNMIGATKIKAVNFVPAIVLAPFAALIAERFF